MIAGVKIELNNKTYTVAPMNFATLINISPLLKSFQSLDSRNLPTEDDFRNMVTILQLALQRNHPEVTFDEVAQGLDITNIAPIMNKIMAASGALSKGEAKAGSQ